MLSLALSLVLSIPVSPVDTGSSDACLKAASKTTVTVQGLAGPLQAASLNSWDRVGAAYIKCAIDEKRVESIVFSDSGDAIALMVDGESIPFSIAGKDGAWLASYASSNGVGVKPATAPVVPKAEISSKSQGTNQLALLIFWPSAALASAYGIVRYRRSRKSKQRVTVVSSAAVASKSKKDGVPDTRFSDVAGCKEAIEDLQEIVDVLKNPDRYMKIGARTPRGALLVGPPGTGKTLMAESMAGETGKPFVFVDPGAFTNMFMGIGVLKVKGLFRKLRKLALRYGGVVVFLDEADALGNRGISRPAMHSGTTDAAIFGTPCNGGNYLSDPGKSLVTSASIATNKFMMGGAAGGGGSGTLQALLTELSGLKKPRGFINRVVRRALGMRPKNPPKYRILVVMATNMPEALDEALLRPGRIDRMYRVGYPSKAGRIRTYEGYLDKVSHSLTAEDIDKLATITPYATGAIIKDTINEALIMAIRNDRTSITWTDVIKAKQLKDLGPAEDVEYIERERHAVAVHEACHGVMAHLVRQHMAIDLATIEKGSDYLGMVASIPPDDQFTRWRTEYEADILVSVASLAGERMFFDGDNSSGVSGDLESATTIASFMEGHWGMGSTISSHASNRRNEVGAPGGNRGKDDGTKDLRMALGDRIENNLATLLSRAEDILKENKFKVLALAHALETHKTISGDDVIAVMNGEKGPLVDGRPYSIQSNLDAIWNYHLAAVVAHQKHERPDLPIPVFEAS